jgi:NAD(P)-dependent dehydrogenase (short-subunit alcohol dehydrogenase family)
MAKELGGRGIAVNTVAPGAIETDFGGGAVRDNPDVNKVFARSAAPACPTISGPSSRACCPTTIAGSTRSGSKYRAGRGFDLIWPDPKSRRRR